MVAMAEIVASEAANSFVKSYSKSGKKVYPNTTRIVKPNEESIFGSGKITTYTINDVKYVVGETRNVNTSSGRASDRYSSQLFKVEMLISVAQHVHDGARIKLVTGLPATHYNDKVSVGLIEEALTGKHTVWVGDEKRTFNIVDVKVLLQPIGTLMYYLFDERGGKKRPEEMNTYKIIIDIGWGTTDIAIVDGMRIVDTPGINTAMLEAYKSVWTGLEQKYGKLRGVPNHLFLEERLRNNDIFKSGGVEYDATDVKRKAFEETAETIISKIANEGIVLEDFDKVIFTGGGVTALAPYLGKFLGDINATRIADGKAQLANAIGFYIYGVIKMS